MKVIKTFLHFFKRKDYPNRKSFFLSLLVHLAIITFVVVGLHYGENNIFI
jgi:hypothetical protein